MRDLTLEADCLLGSPTTRIFSPHWLDVDAGTAADGDQSISWE